ncbi:MAG: hypothetical protein N4A33_04570 [Bacteriovoracaceae bacterium]|nr:hypothetical protein [Bacteriovoracaceae bacterium]
MRKLVLIIILGTNLALATSQKCRITALGLSFESEFPQKEDAWKLFKEGSLTKDQYQKTLKNIKINNMLTNGHKKRIRLRLKKLGYSVKDLQIVEDIYHEYKKPIKGLAIGTGYTDIRHEQVEFISYIYGTKSLGESTYVHDKDDIKMVRHKAESVDDFLGSEDEQEIYTVGGDQFLQFMKVRRQKDKKYVNAFINTMPSCKNLYKINLKYQ